MRATQYGLVCPLLDNPICYEHEQPCAFNDATLSDLGCSQCPLPSPDAGTASTALRSVSRKQDKASPPPPRLAVRQEHSHVPEVRHRRRCRGALRLVVSVRFDAGRRMRPRRVCQPGLHAKGFCDQAGRAFSTAAGGYQVNGDLDDMAARRSGTACTSRTTCTFTPTQATPSTRRAGTCATRATSPATVARRTRRRHAGCTRCLCQGAHMRTRRASARRRHHRAQGRWQILARPRCTLT